MPSGPLHNRRRPLVPFVIGAFLAVLLAAGCGSSSSSDSQHGATRAAHPQEGAVALTAEYLEVKRSAIRRELREGKTLAEIANDSPGHSAKGLLEFAVRVRRESLEAHAREEHVSPQSVNARLAAISARLQSRFTRASIAILSTAYAASAQYLGLTPAELLSKRSTGKSLAQIAEATPGRSEKGLVQAIVRAEQKALLKAGAGSLPVTARARMEQIAERLVKRSPRGGSSSKVEAESGAG